VRHDAEQDDAAAHGTPRLRSMATAAYSEEHWLGCGLVPKRMPAPFWLRLVDWRPIDATQSSRSYTRANSATELREKEGKPPFDDALPGEPDTLFQISKEMLFK
jgi:hypothetical protein